MSDPAERLLDGGAAGGVSDRGVSDRPRAQGADGGSGPKGAAATDRSVAGLQAVDPKDPRLFGIDGITEFFQMRWEDPQTIRMAIRPELINSGGMLSGVATYAIIDYCMGSALRVQTTEQERIATISLSVNYIQTAREGEVVCRTVLDRRTRSNAVLRSEVRHEDDRLLVTAIGSYTIFIPRRDAASR